ncbi:Uncharacterised protein [uncultured archaeon]|nr:Uncharacterised protein [uncultured archaeon]
MGTETYLNPVFNSIVMNFKPSATTQRALQPSDHLRPTQRAFAKWHGAEIPEHPAALAAARKLAVETESMAGKAANSEAPLQEQGLAEKAKMIGYKFWMKYTVYSRWYKAKRRRLQIDIPKMIWAGVERLMSKSKQIIAAGGHTIERALQGAQFTQEPAQEHHEHAHHHHSHHAGAHEHHANEILVPKLWVRTHANDIGGEQHKTHGSHHDDHGHSAKPHHSGGEHSHANSHHGHQKHEKAA